MHKEINKLVSFADMLQKIGDKIKEQNDYIIQFDDEDTFVTKVMTGYEIIDFLREIADENFVIYSIGKDNIVYNNTKEED